MKSVHFISYIFYLFIFYNTVNVSTCRSDGHVTISTTVPDTITSWVASAFAVNKVSGLGIASTPAKVNLIIKITVGNNRI